MSDVRLVPLPLPGLCRVEHKVFNDQRGRFARLFCLTSMEQQGRPFIIRQVNNSKTLEKGSVRGMHYQLAGYAESKLITCLKGAVWDVAVDLRPESPTFLQWYAETLAAEDGHGLLLPAGFAHGFQALTDDAEVLYFSDADYDSQHEAGLSPVDPRLAITWPLPVVNLSAKDAGHPLLEPGFDGVRL